LKNSVSKFSVHKKKKVKYICSHRKLRLNHCRVKMVLVLV